MSEQTDDTTTAGNGSAQPVPPPPPPTVPQSTLSGGFETHQLGGLTVTSNGKRFLSYLLECVLVLITLVIGWFIWSLVVWSKGQTPAKSLMGMRCVRTDTGRAASWGTMALRELVGKAIIGNITFGIATIVSCFMILGESRQGVWDKIANTTVVDDPDGRLAPA